MGELLGGFICRRPMPLNAQSLAHAYGKIRYERYAAESAGSGFLPGVLPWKRGRARLYADVKGVLFCMLFRLVAEVIGGMSSRCSSQGGCGLGCGSRINAGGVLSSDGLSSRLGLMGVLV